MSRSATPSTRPAGCSKTTFARLAGTSSCTLCPTTDGLCGSSPSRNCGFILSTDGNEIYFHRNSVTNGGFDKLAIGDEVRFVAQHSESAEGPQASTVVPLGKHHLPPTEAVRG